MLDMNDVLMRRVKLPSAKRKRSTPSNKEPITGTSKLMFTRSLDNLNSPLAKKQKGTTANVTLPLSSFTSPAATQPVTQAYIDVGQKNFGKYTTCRICGLLYTIGEEEDEKEHQKFCKKAQRGVTIANWKNERLHKSFPELKARIIEIREHDPRAHVKKLLEVKAVLDDALGFVDEHVFLAKNHFLYIKDRQVVGCVTVERIEEAFPIEKNASNLVIATSTPASSTEKENGHSRRNQHLNAKSDNSTNHVDTSPTVGAPLSIGRPVVVGISQIWVHPSHRGNKIATRLVDTLREKYIYGMCIAKHEIAFSQPTANGLGFAKNYVAPHDVLTYDGIVGGSK